MEIKAAIFDLDGTLVHASPEYRYLVVGNTLRTFGKLSSKSLIDDFWFRAETERARVIQKEWGLDPETEFWPSFHSFDSISLRKEHTKPYEDVGILSEIKDLGLKTGVVTSAPERIIKLEIGMLNYSFDSIIRAQLANGVAQKPHPQGIEKCLAELAVGKNEAFYVGNSPEDMEMATNARVRGIFIDRGEYDFGKVDSSLTINSLYALRVLI